MTHKSARHGRDNRDAGNHGPDARERDLFRREMAGATRSQPTDLHREPRPLPSARPRSRDADEAAVMTELLREGPEDFDLESGDELSYRQQGVQRGVLRRLRRGHYRCQAVLDLHGMNVEAAAASLAGFLQHAHEHDWRCVRIIHGKGLRSGHRGPVIKTKVALWLRRRRDVLAYASARPVDGGTGAVCVLLRHQG